MSDYMFMLENHLSGAQNRAVERVQAAAASANMNVFLAGGAMRDVLGGFLVRDLDFSIEGNALKVARTLEESGEATVLATDETRRTAEVLFSGGITGQLASARVERYAKSGGKPQVSPATIQEDLRGRDFTVNAIALSLNRGSRGLLLDPNNGLADLQARELRAMTPYTFFDDPTRMLRLMRLKVRLGFSIEERTARSYANARAAELELQIPARALYDELRRIAGEPSPSQVMRALEDEKLLPLFFPGAAGGKVSLASLVRLEGILKMLPAGQVPGPHRLGPFFYEITEKLGPKEKAAFIKALDIPKPDLESWQKLDARARKLEQALRSPRIRRPSQIYQLVSRAGFDEVVFLLLHSTYKPVLERLRSHFQKYLPALQEIPPAELEPANLKPGTPRYQKAREELIAMHLDRVMRRPAVPHSFPPPVEPAAAKARAAR